MYRNDKVGDGCCGSQQTNENEQDHEKRSHVLTVMLMEISVQSAAVTHFATPTP
jgi:hypothetical protein